MCGIIGAVGQLPDKQKIDAGSSVLSHRGPNDVGVWYDSASGAALAHRRLSIIDLSSAGHQPFISNDGRYVLVFNGEIYNYLELKSELESGYVFHTKTDTEVLMAAYLAWGENCLKRFNGMFAFALWDTAEKKLFCARDRMGEKPFFYYDDGKTFSFASEVKGLLAMGVQRKANEGIIFDYLRFGIYDHTEETFFQGIKQLRPAHSLTWNNGAVITKKYWDLGHVDAAPVKALSDSEIRKTFEDLLADAIRLRFRSDVPVGVNLSSGVDSNGLLYYGEQVIQSRLNTFSMCIPSDEYNECQMINTFLSPEQRAMWHTCMFNPEEVFPLAQRMNEIQDQPYGGIPTIAYLKLNEMAQKNNVTVLLEGQGLDELLAGYAYYRPLWEAEQQGATAASTVGFSQDMSKEVDTDILDSNFLTQHAGRSLTFEAPFFSSLLNAQYRDLLYTKLPRVLRFNDHVSMAFGRELRQPYLDHRLIEFCFSLPASYKINATEQKVLMRDVMRKYMPDVVRSKQKKAFGAVQTEWFRKYQREEIIKIFHSESFRSRSYWSHDALMKKADAFFAGEGNNSFFLWQCINLELWLRTFIDPGNS